MAQAAADEALTKLVEDLYDGSENVRPGKNQWHVKADNALKNMIQWGHSTQTVRR